MAKFIKLHMEKSGEERYFNVSYITTVYQSFYMTDNKLHNCIEQASPCDSMYNGRLYYVKETPDEIMKMIGG